MIETTRIAPLVRDILPGVPAYLNLSSQYFVLTHLSPQAYEGASFSCGHSLRSMTPAATKMSRGFINTINVAIYSSELAGSMDIDVGTV